VRGCLTCEPLEKQFMARRNPARSVYTRVTGGVPLLRALKGSKESALTFRWISHSGKNRPSPAEFRGLAWVSLTFSLLLPGCPLTDDYVILGSSTDMGQSGAASNAPGPSTTAGVSGAEGGADGVGSDPGSGGSGSGGSAGTEAVSGGSAGAEPASGGKPGEQQPVCDDAIVKGSPCDASSIQACYRRCGPDGIGFKSETCQRGSYVEQAGCSFPAGANYACYKVPRSLPAGCPGTAPRAAEMCQISACTACYGGTAMNPLYEDSNGTMKVGYCVCSSMGLWTCASMQSWPCPAGAGCR
jgi:hypothetical protein